MARSYENRVDKYVSRLLDDDGTKHYEKHDLPDNLQELFKSASKQGTGRGIPDFTIQKDKTLIVIENKYGHNFLSKIDTKKNTPATTAKAVADYAVNGAIHYARKALINKDYSDVIAIGITGENSETSGTSDLTSGDVMIEAYYVFDEEENPRKIPLSLHDLSGPRWIDFYSELTVTEEEREKVLKKNYAVLEKTSKSLNRLFYDHSITVENRVILLSGMLLAMMDRPLRDGQEEPDKGLRPEALYGGSMQNSDGNKIYNSISELISLIKGSEDQEKHDMILSLFSAVKNDPDRDKIHEEKTIETVGDKRGDIKKRMTVNKEIFTFIYENVFKTIQSTQHIDHLGEMYSEFLKYALGDGKENGIVLTPPYVTKLMTHLIGVDEDSRVFDPCSGSAGFLVASMTTMLEKLHASKEDLTDYEVKEHECSIKFQQLMGTEKDLKMFGLSVANMILRGDGYSQIHKGDFFHLKRTNDQVKNFAPDKVLINPPFSYAENGMPFVLEALDMMDKGGICGVIIQDSAGTGRAITTNKKILASHSLLGSIRMPADLFQPSAGVQTSIYIFKAHKKHDFDRDVVFIDFADDGQKRTKRGLRTIGDPEKKYENLRKTWEYKKEVPGSGIDIILDTITDSGEDWNYTQHVVYDTEPTEEDFMKVTGDFMSFELNMILSGKGSLIGLEDIDV